MEANGTLSTQSQSSQADIAKSPLLNYEEYAATVKELINNFNTGERARIERRRELRRHVVNVGEMRAQKKLLPDETVIPDRTADTNIRAAKPPFVRYLTEPTTVLSFTDANQPNANFTPFADYYTKINRTPGWQVEWLFLVDCIQTHGAGYLEVVPSSNQLGTEVQYIRRDQLIFPDNARSLNAQSIVLRELEFTKTQFEEFAKNSGLDEAESKLVSEYMKERTELVRIYRAYIRSEGVIKLAYLGLPEYSNKTWLREPKPYSLGELTQNGSPVPLKELPIILFPFDLEEDEQILKTQGRVALDVHIQEALTAVVSATVNTAYRASGCYPVKKDPENLGKATMDVTLKHGQMLMGDIDFKRLDWPNAIAISIAQFLRTTAAAQAGQPDWTAMNRADTAKTAYEINAAREEAGKLSSIGVTLFALNSLRVELIRWRVWLSLVIAKQRQVPEFPGVNIFSPTLIPMMSADAQVVRQAELMAKYVQYLPFVAGTPFHLPMLDSMLEAAFPLQIVMWREKINVSAQQQQAAATANQTLAAVFQALRGLRGVTQLPPDEQSVMEQLLNELGAYLQSIAPAPKQQ